MDKIKGGIEVTGTLYTSALGDAKDKLAMAEQVYDNSLKKFQSDINKNVNELNTKIHKITYDELLRKTEDAELIPGDWYQITDYKSYFISDVDLFEDDGVIAHQFDVLVFAISNNALSENAKATAHNDDYTYYGDGIHSWILKYCLYNDKTRFGWAATDGKGVIYRMIDEYGNDCGYDFKTLVFIKGDKRHYTFSYISEDFENSSFTEDLSVSQVLPCKNNIITNIQRVEDDINNGHLTGVQDIPCNELVFKPADNITSQVLYDIVENNKLINCNNCVLYSPRHNTIINSEICNVNLKNNIIVNTIAHINNSNDSESFIKNCTIYDSKLYGWIGLLHSNIESCNNTEIYNSNVAYSIIKGLYINPYNSSDNSYSITIENSTVIQSEITTGINDNNVQYCEIVHTTINGCVISGAISLMYSDLTNVNCGLDTRKQSVIIANSVSANSIKITDTVRGLVELKGCTIEEDLLEITTTGKYYTDKDGILTFEPRYNG